MPDKVFNAANSGDNCATWLLRIGEEKDVTVNLRHIMEFDNGRFALEIVNTGETVHSMQELVPTTGRYV